MDRKAPSSCKCQSLTSSLQALGTSWRVEVDDRRVIVEIKVLGSAFSCVGRLVRSLNDYVHLNLAVEPGLAKELCTEPERSQRYRQRSSPIGPLLSGVENT